MATCNRIENGSCRGCDVPAILWRAIKPGTREMIDTEAQRLSAKYCPTGSGGIDGPTKSTIYNYRVPEVKLDTIW